MRRLLRIWVVLLGGLAFSVATPGCSSSKQQSAPKNLAGPTYLNEREFDPSTLRALLGGPPPDDSPEHRREVDQMLTLQATRSPAEVQRCKQEETVTVFAFSNVLGPWFKKKNLPVTVQLMQQVYVDAKVVSDDAKRIWNRQRPPLADSRIHPCVQFEHSPSFPSGHAVRGVVWATLLSEIFPTQRDALMARGFQIGNDRFLAGMHYPSDVAAGQKLGAEIAQRLMARGVFMARLEEARAECLAAVRGQAASAPAELEPAGAGR